MDPVFKAFDNHKKEVNKLNGVINAKQKIIDTMCEAQADELLQEQLDHCQKLNLAKINEIHRLKMGVRKMVLLRRKAEVKLEHEDEEAALGMLDELVAVAVNLLK